MMGHLKAADFTDFLEGIPLTARKAAHFEDCEVCRSSLAAISPYFEDVSAPAPSPLAVAQLDSDELRSAVRDRLLARAVKKSSFIPRWTGQHLTPTAAWGLSLALLVSIVTFGGIWHYRTAHETTIASVSYEVDLEDSNLELALFLDDSTALEAEAIAWSDNELFIALNELEESEEETLRELIALAFEGNNGV